MHEILLAGEGFVASVTWFEARIRGASLDAGAMLCEEYVEVVTVDITRDLAERLPVVKALIAGAGLCAGAVGCYIALNAARWY